MKKRRTRTAAAKKTDRLERGSGHGSGQGSGRPSAAALSPAELAALLSRASGRVISMESISASIEGGAPTNPDGTINLVHYGAWLLRQPGKGAGGD